MFGQICPQTAKKTQLIEPKTLTLTRRFPSLVMQHVANIYPTLTQTLGPKSFIQKNTMQSVLNEEFKSNSYSYTVDLHM